MADPPATPATPATQEDVNTIVDETLAAGKLTEAFGGLNSIVNTTKGVMGEFSGVLNNVSGFLKSTSALTADQTIKFGLFTTTMIGARNAFADFSEASSSSGLSTFSSQFNDVIDILSKGKNAMGELTNFALTKFNIVIPPDKTKTVADATAFVKNLANNFVQAADNGLKLQHGFVQMSARTGNLGRVLATAGEDLQNMNNILAEQQNMLNKSQQATGLSADQIEKFYAQLGKVPGALEAVITRTKGSSDTTNMLTATIQLAAGSGMKYDEILTSLSESFKKYGATGETALTFTARMAEISRNYGVELDDIKAGLTSAADAFKYYGSAGADAGRMLEGTARVMNTYISALKESGLSGAEATKVASNMTNQLNNLNLAQRAFLSAQTGGPGGLMGGYQIEKMMKEGRIDEVMEKVRQTMTKQFGKIVTVEEAAASPQAAAQLTKQRLMLQQGPLGKLAETPEQASRILEAFSRREKGAPVKELSTAIVQDTMKTGLKFQETSATELTTIRSLLQGAQGAANIPALGAIEKAATARVGTTAFGQDTEAQGKARLNRQQFMARGSAGAGESAASFSLGMAQQKVEDRSGQFSRNIIQEYDRFFNELSDALQAPIDFVKDLFQKSAKDPAQRQRALKALDANIANMQEQEKHEQNKEAKTRLQAEIAKRTALRQQFIEASLTTVNESAPAATPAPRPARTAPRGRGNPVIDAYMQRMEAAERSPSANRVAGAIPATSRVVGATTTGRPGEAATASGAAPGAAPTEAAQNVIYIKGVCIHCNREMEEGRAQMGVSGPQTRQK